MQFKYTHLYHGEWGISKFITKKSDRFTATDSHTCHANNLKLTSSVKT